MTITEKICEVCNNSYQYGRRKGETLAMCARCYVGRKIRNLKQRAVDYKGGACEVCGYNKSLTALCFHHRDPSQKEFCISGRSIAWARIQAELDKCQLLCLNHHAEQHAGVIQR